MFIRRIFDENEQKRRRNCRIHGVSTILKTENAIPVEGIVELNWQLKTKTKGLSQKKCGSLY